MYCSYCGNKALDDADFCHECGNALRKEECLIKNNNKVIKAIENGPATASLVLGILAIISGIITLLIALGISAYFSKLYYDFYGYLSDNSSEIVFTAICVLFVPAVLAIISFCLALGSQGKIKNRANIAGRVLSIITFIICILDYIIITS